ncbi:MAG: hypothetical protein KDD67_12615 [Ignavibacteriae bacterium]|nr:hypothetical protein [Ignavibacteriota bacterium]MCB9214317.1 hypothetical protein [Ignavibacteria bacterium]
MIQPQDQKFINQWEGTRAKGKWRYIFITGLTWGFLSAIFSRLFEILVNGSSFSQTFLSTNFLLFLGIFMFIGGPLFGLTIWTLSERKYRKLKEKA